MICDYCKKEITDKDTYGELGSGLLTHSDSCYNEAFRSKLMKARIFRIKNNILYRIHYLQCLYWWITMRHDKNEK